MEGLFLKTLNMSITATYVLIAVIVLRLILKRAPKWISYALWSLVLFRLVCPTSISSAFSVFGRIGMTASTGGGIEYIPTDIGMMAAPQVDIGTTSINTVINNALPAAAPAASVNPLQILVFIGACIWVVGFALMLIYSVVSYLRLRRRMMEATLFSGNIFETDRISSPFVCGLVRPKIYLPVGLSGNKRDYVLRHEQTHISRRDYLIKPIAFLALSVHWFNPFIWLAFSLMSRDLEMSCDEKVVSGLDSEGKTGYSIALMQLAMKQPVLAGSPLAFGESGAKGRIKNVLNYRKPALWTLAVAVVIIIAAGIVLLTNPTRIDTPVTSAERTGPFAGYVKNAAVDTFDVYTEEGGTYITSLPWAIFDQFPASDRTDPNWQPGWMNVDVYCGSINDFTWAMVCTGPSAGTGNANICTSMDGGKTWWVGDVNAMYAGTVTGAGFASSEIGFMSYRYFFDQGPEISRTINGGKTWERMTVVIPDYLREYKMTPLVPTFAGESGIYPIELYDSDANFNSVAYLTTEDGGMTWQWIRKTDTTESVDSATPKELFATSTGDIHDYLPKLIAGETVSPYDLLPCLERFTRSTWLELDKAYGQDWWNPLWVALRDAAISDKPTESDDQSLRDYYIGKAYLVSDGAYTEGLTDIVLLQWDNDSVMYSACLNTRFSDEEEARLRLLITYEISYDMTGGLSPFGMFIPGSERSIYLGTYPVVFPFACDLTEKSRRSFQAESFGPIVIVECDGLQVTYLNNSEGVNTVITVRADKKHYAAAGIAIGDTKELLLARWPDKLKELDRISYDDEAWFGNDYDSAYAYMPGESTKSILFIVKDSMVSGIEIINGLDGAMY